jgi:two-component system, NarL family, nitrate/nitrite response regulator NarL
MTVRVLVVDQQPLFSRGLELLLPTVSDGRVEVVGSTDEAAAAASLVRSHRPDLVLVDLGLAPPGGLRAIAAIRRLEPRLPVVAMLVDRTGAAAGGPGPAAEALAAGASGLLVKAQEPEELLTPLLAAAEGWAVVPPQVLAQLVASRSAAAPRRDPGLTADERRLWALLARGASTAQISGELHVSERTVKRLTAALLRRLGVGSRTEAAVLAGRSGLLDAG